MPEERNDSAPWSFENPPLLYLKGIIRNPLQYKKKSIYLIRKIDDENNKCFQYNDTNRIEMTFDQADCTVLQAEVENIRPHDLHILLGTETTQQWMAKLFAVAM